MMGAKVRSIINTVSQESPMSVLLRRVCSVALIATVAGLGLMTTGCKHTGGTGSEETVVDSTPVIIGLSVARVGDSTVGYVSTPEGDAILVETVEISSTEKEFTLTDSSTVTKTQIDDIKANPAGYSLVVDEAKKISVVGKAK